MEMSRDLRPHFCPDRLVPENDAANFHFVRNAAAAMVLKARIMVADDPGPVESRSQIRHQRTSARGKPFAAELIVEAVAEAVEPRRPAALGLARERSQG